MVQLLLHPDALCRKLAVHEFTDAERDNSSYSCNQVIIHILVTEHILQFR